MSKTSNRNNIDVTDRELAFITLCRRLQYGTITGVGIVKGEPTALVGITERIDLAKPDDLEKAMRGGLLPLTGEMEAKTQEQTSD